MFEVDIDTKVEAPVQFELPTKVKLSDAMREGCKLGPKLKGQFVARGRTTTYTCALGAAYSGSRGIDSLLSEDYDDVGYMISKLGEMCGIDLDKEIVSAPRS